MRKWLCIILLICLSMNTACNYRQQFENSESSLGTRNKNDLTEPRAYGFQTSGIEHHEFNQMQFGLTTATEVMQMDGVSAAYVLLTDQNAYVAIATDDTATGTSARGQVRDQNNTGTMEGIYDPERNTSYAPPNNIVNKTNSDYTIRNPKDLSSKLKQKIAKKVRELHPDIQEVFITANADILNRMNVYAIHAWQGNNLDSYIEEFKNMAKTHFVE